MNPLFPRGKDTRSAPGFNFRMMELQGAIGIEQLKKLDYGIAKQRENKKAIRNGIEDLGLEFRMQPYPPGEIGDTLIFFMKDASSAKGFAKCYNAKGLLTKNLPDAVSWHFAGEWSHLLGKYYQKERHLRLTHGTDLTKLWPQSTDIISRSIAIPININMTNDNIEYIVKSIRECVK
jgi:8-amino-3,8-dideoxy-alpha-D-manno-octulosonate transaminase